MRYAFTREEQVLASGLLYNSACWPGIHSDFSGQPTAHMDVLLQLIDQVAMKTLALSGEENNRRLCTKSKLACKYLSHSNLRIQQIQRCLK